MTRWLAGTVKRFSELEGYGYIRPDDDTKELVFHRVCVVDVEALRESLRVSYELRWTKHGQRIATNVSISDDCSDASYGGPDANKRCHTVSPRTMSNECEGWGIGVA